MELSTKKGFAVAVPSLLWYYLKKEWKQCKVNIYFVSYQTWLCYLRVRACVWVCVFSFS